MRAVLVIALVVLAGNAAAADWAMQPGSSLGFSASYQGEAFSGNFGKFTPTIRFDPAKLADARFDVRIVLASADTKNSERDDLLKSGDFFDSKRQPEARYTASRFRALGGNRYAADGALSLRGVSKPVVLTFTWTAGAKPVLDGSASLKRLDFGVGSGDWTDVDLLPNEVKVKTHLILAPMHAPGPAAKKP